ncbi:MAG: hypothetical protein ABFC96_02285 [Thermoguttaceae bacterium]
MRGIAITAGILVVVATIVLCLFASAKVISVGDDASVLRAFKDYGYPEERFSVLPYRGPDGKRHIPRFFHLGNNWYIRVWHSDRIEDITHFKAVPHEHAYTDFVDNRELTSFTIPRSSFVPYFIGLAVLFAISWAVHRRRTVYRCLLGVLIFLLVVGNLGVLVG